MNKHCLRRLVGIGLMLGSTGFIVLAWYAYFVLKRADISQVLLASIFFGGCALGGFLYLTIKDEEGVNRVIPDFQRLERLSKGQNLMVGLVGLTLGACSLWLSIGNTIQVYGLYRIVLGIGAFYFFYLRKLPASLHRAREMEACVCEVGRKYDADPRDEDRYVPSKDGDITGIDDAQKVRASHYREDGSSHDEVQSLFHLRDLADVPAIVHEHYE